MLFQHLPEIHSVELISRKNQNVFMRMIVKMNQPLPNRIRRPLIPFGSLPGLLGSYNFNESARNKIIKPVALLNMPVK